jgi:hypothetical protein
MKSQKTVFMAVLVSLCNYAVVSASTLTGKVTGPKGVSVVYVEAIAGKTFPAPAASEWRNAVAAVPHPRILRGPVRGGKVRTSSKSYRGRLAKNTVTTDQLQQITLTPTTAKSNGFCLLVAVL